MYISVIDIEHSLIMNLTHRITIYTFICLYKLVNRCRGWPESSLFNCYYIDVLGRAQVFSWIAQFYPWSVPYNAGICHTSHQPDEYGTRPFFKGGSGHRIENQGVIEYYFLSFWYDQTWDRTLVTRVMSEHSDRYVNGPLNTNDIFGNIYEYIYKWIIFSIGDRVYIFKLG